MANHSAKVGWPAGLDGNFMDPSRAMKLSDGSFYITCGAGCMGACKSPRDDGKAISQAICRCVWLMGLCLIDSL